jgi:hypothetical protein
MAFSRARRPAYPFLDLPTRDPTLEKLFIVPNHPQRSHIPTGTTYVYVQDTSAKGLAATWASESKREVPSGTLKEHLAQGINTQILRIRALNNLRNRPNTFARG